uniref:KIF-binding protein-like n=1 Tax=Styela clava TaxID=7725 RepID=UPI00193969D2|nr:KIF-binding protein-like [Styela clava]
MNFEFSLPQTLLEYFESEGYEAYNRVRVLTDEESLKDPENDPFKSKYKAREKLQEILNRIHKEREENESDPSMKILEAAIQYQLGFNYTHTEERPAGEECLDKCIALLKDDELLMRPEAVSIAMIAYSELGIVWASRYQGRDQAMFNLKKVESLYNKYKHEVGLSPFAIDESLRPKEEKFTDMQRDAKFEKIFTHTLFYLAQMYKQSDENDLSAAYCQRTLRRQLESKEYDPKEWAVNSAGLSQYYICQNMYREAKHCLACANVIMEEAKPQEGLPEPKPDDDNETIMLRNEIPQKKADIARCWVKYFLALLDYSKELLYNDVCELDVNRQAEAILRLQLNEENDNDVPKDHDRMPLEVDSVEENARHLPVTTFEESRQVFLIAKKYVDSALEFFVMDGFVTDNIELTQDMSALYKHLIFFETEKERKCKMHKRRIDLLTQVLNEINPQFFLLICRQLQFEIGEIYGAMLDLKIAIANESTQTPTHHAIKKINLLCRSSILYFTKFLDTLRNTKKVFPFPFDEDVEHPAIIAHFHVARLYSKIIAPVRSEKLNFLKKSLEYYSWIVDYVDRKPECEVTVQKEVEICREMKVLLPKAMERYME